MTPAEVTRRVEARQRERMKFWGAYKRRVPGQPATRREDTDMASFNKVILMGNLTRDPQLKHLPSNIVVAEFGMACNRRYRTTTGEDREEVAFVDCTAFAKQAEVIGQYCTKGKPLFVEGRLKYDTWDDKQGGGKRSKLSVVVENFQFIGGRDGDGSGAPDYADGGAERPASRPGRAEQRGREGWPKDGGQGGRRRPAQSPIDDEPQFAPSDVPFAWEGRQGQSL